MATDAEITLKFTAEIQEALKAIRMLRDEIEKIKAAGGFLSPEDMDLISEMKTKLDEYTRTVRELQIEYYRLQQRSGEMSAEFIAQTTNLRQQIIETQRQVSKLTEKYEKQGKVVESLKKRVKDLEDGHKRTEDNGIHAYRSLRTAIGHFIVNLAKGKLAVNELGMALKGLAYSTVILAAISATMDGLRLAWDAIKGVFGQSEEEMKAAEDAAKRAQTELTNAKKVAEDAAKRVKELQDKLAEKEAAESLKETLASITDEYNKQRTAVEDTLAAIKEQAQVKARERAAEAAQRTGELDMELLGLEERFVTGDIDTRNYVIQKADIEKRKREEARVAAVDAAEIERDAAAERTKAAKAELKNAQDRVTAAEEEAAKYATDDDVELAETEREQLRTRMEEKLRELERLEAEFEEKYNGRLGIWGPTRDQMEHELKTGRILHKETRQYKADKERIADARNVANIASDRELAKADEVKALKESAARGKEASTRLNEERKTAEKLEKDADAAVKEEQKANDTLRDTLAKTSREGGLDDRMTAKRVDIGLVKIDKDEQKKSNKAAEKNAKAKEKAEQRRQEMERLAADIAEQAQIAAGTSKDTDDKAVLDKIRKGIDKYGAAFSSVVAQQNGIISAVEMLQANTNRNERTLKELQSRIDKLVKQGKVQDTRSRKRSSL